MKRQSPIRKLLGTCALVMLFNTYTTEGMETVQGPSEPLPTASASYKSAVPFGASLTAALGAEIISLPTKFVYSLFEPFIEAAPSIIRTVANQQQQISEDGIFTYMGGMAKRIGSTVAAHPLDALIYGGAVAMGWTDIASAAPVVPMTVSTLSTLRNYASLQSTLSRLPTKTFRDRGIKVLSYGLAISSLLESVPTVAAEDLPECKTNDLMILTDIVSASLNYMMHQVMQISDVIRSADHAQCIADILASHMNDAATVGSALGDTATKGIPSCRHTYQHFLSVALQPHPTCWYQYQACNTAVIAEYAKMPSIMKQAIEECIEKRAVYVTYTYSECLVGSLSKFARSTEEALRKAEVKEQREYDPSPGHAYTTCADGRSNSWVDVVQPYHPNPIPGIIDLGRPNGPGIIIDRSGVCKITDLRKLFAAVMPYSTPLIEEIASIPRVHYLMRIQRGSENINELLWGVYGDKGARMEGSDGREESKRAKNTKEGSSAMWPALDICSTRPRAIGSIINDEVKRVQCLAVEESTIDSGIKHSNYARAEMQHAG